MKPPIEFKHAPIDEKSFSNIDRRMALAFGLLIFSLMLAALLASGWYVRGLMEQDQNRFAAMTTQVLADAVDRVGFLGKYHVRLFLQRVKQEQTDIVYIRLLDRQGMIVADSDPRADDGFIGKEEKAYIAPVLDGTAPLLTRGVYRLDGELVHEVSIPYRNGLENGDRGVIQIGISDSPRQAELRDAAFIIFLVLFVLLVIGVLAASRMSKYFGLPVRNLAAETGRERQRLENILESMHAGTWEWNIRTGEMTVNERWAGIMGYALSELQPVDGRTFARLCHPDDLALSRRKIQAHFSGRTDTYSCEVRMRHTAGHWVWVLDSGSIVERDEHGAPLRMMGARQDIAERKRTEEAFRQESERFMGLARVSNTGVWEWDKAHGSLWCSPEYFTMLGLDPADYADPARTTLKNAWLDLLHPDDLDRARRHFADYLVSGSSRMYQAEFRMRHANGTWIHIWSRGSILRGADGGPASKMLGTHIDVTSLKEALAQLRDSQQRLQRISDNIPDSMVYQLDCGGPGGPRRFTYLSGGVQRIHGLAPEEAIRDPDRLFSQVDAEDLAMIAERERESIAGMTDFRAEVRCRLPDGRRAWILLTASPRKMDDGHMVFDGISIDITERRQQEERIHELNTMLEQRVQERTAKLSSALEGLRRTQKELLQSEKLASLGALVAGVAHELNTPIGTAVTVASTLVQTHKRFKAMAETGLTRGALAEYLSDVEEGGLIIERNLSRAAELIGGFKQLAVDQTSYQRREFALHELVQEIVLSMRPTLRRTRFELVADIPHDLVLDSLPGPLGQVLINLVNNAVVHAFGDRDAGTIALSARGAGAGWMDLTVSDDGRGIPAEHQRKIFDPFFTTRLGQGGSGLGLHITYTLVTGPLGGRIELHSAPGQGTRFVLHLPLVAPVPTASGKDEDA